MCALTIIGLTAAPKLFGINDFIVLSGSMEPTIQTGSMAYINTKDKDLKTDDIATYKLFGVDGNYEYVTHRVVGFDSEGSYIFKGDVNEVVDANPVQKNRIEGKYMFSIPELGFFMDKFSTRYAVIGVIWVVILNIANYIFEYLGRE